MGERVPPVIVVHYSQVVSGFSLGGASPLSVSRTDRVENWRGLDGETYEDRKASCIRRVGQVLEAECPGFSAEVEHAEIATARTMAKLLGTPSCAVFVYAPDVPAAPLSDPPIHVTTQVVGVYLAFARPGFGGFTGAMGCGALAAKAALRFRP